MKVELSAAVLTEFATSVDKVFSKPKQVCIVGEANRVTFFTAHDAQQVAFSIETPCEDFSVAVEAPRFLTACKQMYHDHAVMDFKAKHAVLNYGDVQVKLPFQKPGLMWVHQDYTAFDVPPGFLAGLTHTMFVPEL